MMTSIIAEVSSKNTERANPVLFNRNAQHKIHEYVVEGYKSMEALAAIKLIKWELVTDESKIDIKLKRKYLKNKILQKDKTIEKIKAIDETAIEMLVADFRIEYEGEIRYITKKLLIPAYVDDYHLLVNGNHILPIWQLIDMSTYTRKKSLMLRTTLTPVELYREVYKKMSFETTEGEKFEIKAYILNLFTKQQNPLTYYVANMGVTKTINYFSMSGIVDVTEEEYNTEINHYFRVNKSLFIEVDKRFFKENEFVQQFAFLIFETFGKRTVIDNIDDINYWTIKLGSLFTINTKNQLSKGQNVLISFGRCLDGITKGTLKWSSVHLASSYSLIRYMMQNFKELRQKDNYDLKFKRVRINEALAFYFIRSTSSRINLLLGKRKLCIESFERIFNFNEDELFKLLIYGKNPSTLLRYSVDVNDFAAMNALRYTRSGIQGLNCPKAVPKAARDIHYSQIGRIDLNAISHGTSTGITGMLVPTAKIDEQGFFCEEASDPDVFSDNLRELKASLYDKNIAIIKEEINELKTMGRIKVEQRIYANGLRGVNGRVVIQRRIKMLYNGRTGRTIINSRNSEKRTYVNEDGLIVTEGGRFLIDRLYKPILQDNRRFRIASRSPKKINKNGRVVIESRKKPLVMRNDRVLIGKR